MGRYADLSFLREGQVPENAGDFVAREAWLGRLVASLMLFALGAGVLVAGYLALGEVGGGWRIELSFNSLFNIFGVGIVGLIGLLAILAGLLGGLAYFTTFLAALKPSNWVLRAAPDGLYVKLRAFTDHRRPEDDPIVAFIPRREVRWLRTHDQLARHVDRGGDVASTEDDALAAQQYLEIDLHGGDLAELKTRLERERGAWGSTLVRGIRQKSKGAAVSIRPEDVIRIDWKTKGTRLRPKLSEAMAHLGREYPMAPDLKSEQKQAKELERDAQERRLLDMVLQGNTIDAVIVAKNLYGFTTTQAKQFVDDLQKP